MAIYSKAAGNNSATGRINTPIKMIIEHESNLMAKKGGTRDWLFNVEKSNRFGETIMTQKGFTTFMAAAEGESAATDTVIDNGSNFIEHIQFMKEFVITAEMMEDANYGIAADAKRRAESFVRSYYKTMNKACETALAYGTNATVKFNGGNIKLSTSDGYPLFSGQHYYGDNPALSQPNYFWGDALRVGDERTLSPAAFAKMLYAVSSKIRNMKDDNHDILGYTADTLVLPGNRPILEAVAKTVCGSDKASGYATNDINLHYGNWNIVIMPSWDSYDDRFIVMSSEANKNLAGNMFFDRVPLTVTNWIDHHTGNSIWNGRCRFGIGFGSYKHIAMVVDSSSSVDDAVNLAF